MNKYYRNDHSRPTMTQSIQYTMEPYKIINCDKLHILIKFVPSFHSKKYTTESYHTIFKSKSE